MAQADFGTGKSLVVLAIVLGCFAVLWPKIFYPMMQTAFAMTSPKVDSDGRFQDPERPPHLHPASMNPRGRGPPPEDVHDKFLMREGRPFPHPQARQPVKSQPKSGGAMSIIMPIYTVGIVVFFLYTVLKLVFKKPEGDKKPLIKDFHMDPDYRKFVCQQPTTTTTETTRAPKVKKAPRKTLATVEESSNLENEAKEMDAKDYEIFKLKKKLEETEQAMERIIKHMGVVNACLTERVQLEKKIADTQSNDVRQRHTGSARKKAESAQTSKRCHIQEVVSDEHIVDCDSVSTLEEDLSELISMCSETHQAVKSFGEKDPEEEAVKEEGNTDGSDESGDESDHETGQSNDAFEEKEPCSVNGYCKNVSCA